MKKNGFYARTFVIVLCVLSVLLCSCNSDRGDNNTTEPYSYNSTTERVTSDLQSSQNPEKSLTVNNSWQSNFKVSYEYYNSAESKEAITINETKTASEFTAEYPDGNSLLYYKAAGNSTDYYVINTQDKTAVHSSLAGDSFSELSSTFMKLTRVSSELPTLSNVMYMYDEDVNGRACRKYLQRAYSDGKLTDSVYIWIDIEFGFAAKCESYNADGKMRLMWNTKSFESGSVGENEISVDLSNYTVKED